MANNDIQPSNNAKQILTKATDEEVANSISDEYGVKYSSDGKKLIKAPKGIREYTIKPGTEIICLQAFYKCELLTSIEIPNSVSVIGDDAFCSCTGLTSVKIPNSVTHIGFEAFHRCTGLTSIEIPDSVIQIDYNAFDRCINLKHVTIASRIIHIGIWAFKECRNLKSVTFSYPLIHPTSIKNRIKIEIDEMAFMGCPIESLVIPIRHEDDRGWHTII